MTQLTAGNGETPRVKFLLASRVVEQGVIGLGALLLARALGVDAYAPVALIFVIYTFAITTSDFGLGIGVLRHPGDQFIAHQARRRVRLVNAGIAAAAVAVGVALRSDAGFVVAAGGVIWALGSEASVAKAVALKFGRARRAAVAEGVGAAMLGTSIVAGALVPSAALFTVAIGFGCKLLIEIAMLWPANDAFLVDGDRPQLAHLWGTIVLAYAISNVDYLVVGSAFSQATLAVYLLAFRLANAVPAQVGVVAVRVSLVDLAVADLGRRQQVYDQYVRRVALVGLAGAVLTIAAAPVLPVILGPEWVPVVGIVMTLAVVVPWRLVLSISGSLAMAGGVAAKLLRWEVCRLTVVVIVLVAASRVGLGFVVGAVAASEVLATLTYHGLATRATGIRPPALMWPVAAVTLVVVIALATTISAPA